MYIILILILIYLIINNWYKSKNTVEKFISTIDPKFALDYNDSGYDLAYKGDTDLNDEKVPEYISVTGLDKNKQKYLQFLGDTNDKFKEYMPKTGTFRGSCDDKINEKIQKRILSEVFEKGGADKSTTLYKTEHSRVDPNKSYDCVGISNNLCESVNPFFYLSDSTHFPPPWTVSTYKDIDYPKNTNLNCFSKTFDCCRSSLN